MKYTVMAPCVVRQDGGRSAATCRKVGVEIEANPADVEYLTKAGFLAPVEG